MPTTLTRTYVVPSNLELIISASVKIENDETVFFKTQIGSHSEERKVGVGLRAIMFVVASGLLSFEKNLIREFPDIQESSGRSLKETNDALILLSQDP